MCDFKEMLFSRENAKIWKLVEVELGGEYVLASPPTTGGGMATGSNGCGESPIITVSRTNEEESKNKQRIQEGFDLYDQLEALGEKEVDRRYGEFELKEKNDQEEKERISKLDEQEKILKRFNLKASESMILNYCRLPTWTYREGMCLLHELDPDECERFIKITKSEKKNLKKLPLFSDFFWGMEISERAINTGELRRSLPIADFVKWAESRRLNLSKLLLDSIAKINSNSVEENTSPESFMPAVTMKDERAHTSESLALLNEIILEFWEGKDLDDAAKQATNDAVIAWGKERVPDVSGTMLKYMAMIARPNRYK